MNFMRKLIERFSTQTNSKISAKSILKILDQASEDARLPMLDNGYTYLAASRLSLYRSDTHWAMVFEIFGFSPRSGHPDLSVTTISNRLYNRNKPSDYVSKDAYQSYIKDQPNSEMRFFSPITDDGWIDEHSSEFVIPDSTLTLRETPVRLPTISDFISAEITLAEDQPAIFEVCRYLAKEFREDVLATDAERKVSIDPAMKQVMKLDSWHHPDLAANQMPSQTQTFRQLAKVIESNDVHLFTAPEPANNHWKNWPDGGTL